MISVIVPARDAASTIEECIHALKEQEDLQYGLDYEVIVVDDGSADDTAELAGRWGVRVIRQNNAGPAAARNAGVGAGNGTLLAFTDADCAPSPTWLKVLTKPFLNPQVVGVKGVYRTRQTAPVARFVQLEYQYKYAHMQGLNSIDFIDTYSAAYRKDIFLLNGGFDESFPSSSVEDQEFSFRLARKGYLLQFEPEAVVFHCHDQNLSEYIRRKFGIGYWKAYMLHWIPEKTFSDSHTAPTQRLEIMLSAILLAVIPFIFVWPLYALGVFVSGLLIFLAVISPFLSYVYRNDRRIIWIAPGMLICRAGALGCGLLKGFLWPPKSSVKGFPCQHPGVRFVKRLIDVLGSILGILIFSPVIACAALAIRLNSRGPVIFRQLRAGENGKPFVIYKLRTMVEGAEQMLEPVVHNSCIEGPAFKIPHDPRVTRVGRYLRRWSLDELPQFLNVLKGEMSLVGPRPEEVRIVDQYNDYQRQRLMVRPGLTGPMQVSGRGGLDFDRRLQLEIDYLRNYSLLEDIKILLKTLSAVLSGEGVS